MQHPSSSMHCLLMAPRVPRSLVSPCFTWDSISASFTDSSSASSGWRALGRSQRAPLLFPSELPPSVILPICDFKCLQKLICHVLHTAQPSLLRSRLVYPPALGEASPVPLALCVLHH